MKKKKGISIHIIKSFVSGVATATMAKLVYGTMSWYMICIVCVFNGTKQSAAHIVHKTLHGIAMKRIFPGYPLVLYTIWQLKMMNVAIFMSSGGFRLSDCFSGNFERVGRILIMMLHDMMTKAMDSSMCRSG